MFLFLIFRSRATIVADNSVYIVYNFVYSITTEEIALYSNNNNNDNNNNNNNSAPPYRPPPRHSPP